MEVFEAIQARRTIRTYTGKKIPRDDLEKMVDAGRLAPSAKNKHMRDFVVATQKETLEKILVYFHSGREYKTYEDGKFDGTSAIIAVIVDESNEYWKEDGSAAAQNILLTARSLGWGSCWIEGQMRPHEEEFKGLLDVPKGKRILLLIAIGEPVKWSPPPLKRSLEEVIHWEKYKKS
jgi:nitroreductase